MHSKSSGHTCLNNSLSLLLSKICLVPSISVGSPMQSSPPGKKNAAGGRQRRSIPGQVPPAPLQEGDLHIPGVLCCFSSPPAGSPGVALLPLLRLPRAQTALLFPPLPLPSSQALPQPLYAVLTATPGKEVPGHHPSDPSPSLL